MPRKIDDVIIPERKRTIRDIPIPPRSRREENTASAIPPKDYSFQEKGNTPKGSKKRLWIALGFAAILTVFATLSIFSGATLSYVPKSAALAFKGDVYTARKTGNTFPYSVVKLSKEKSASVPASGTTEVERKASGTIVVYNNASAEPQKFRATTRFESSDGKIYQVPDAIVVPGKTVANGVEKPGTLEVVVYGEKPGTEYNIGLSDFTLPGLKGTSLYSGIYARSKTPMTGGLVGREAVVKNEEKVQAEAELSKSLEAELISEARAQVPEGFIMFPSLTSVTFESLPQSPASGSNANIKVRGSFAGVMFKESDLSNHLAQPKIKLASGESVGIVPIEALEISFAGNAPKDLASSEEVSLSVTGEAMAVWRTDEVALKTDLTGRHKRDISSILSNYPTVVSATATVKPFWKNAFPSDSNKIMIKQLPVK